MNAMLCTLRTLTLLLTLGVATNARAQFRELATFAPRDANAIVAIDVAALQKTRMAEEQGWSRKLETAYVNRSIYLPPEASQLLVASTLRMDRGFDSDSTVAVLKSVRNYSLPAIARANGGRIEALRGKDVVAGTGDSFLVPLAPDVLAIFAPENRQLASRWIGELSGSRPAALSPFLSQALAAISQDQQIVLAIDLQDAVSAAEVREKLVAARTLDGSPYKLDDVATQLATLKGATILVAVGLDARATAHVEFGQPVGVSAAIAKRIILDVVREQGLEMDDLADHHFNVSGNAVIVEGALSSSGLRRLMSLLEIPPPRLEPEATPPADGAATSAETMATASQAYYRSVVSLLDDLRGDRAKQDPRGGMDAVWMNKYAQKIDRLPVLNVDAEILDWGAKTAQTLRVMASTRSKAGLSAGAQKSGLRTGAFTDSYYNVGVNSATATANDANQIDVQTANVATANRVEGWRLIDNATADIRRSATQRYGVEF